MYSNLASNIYLNSFMLFPSIMTMNKTSFTSHRQVIYFVIIPSVSNKDWRPHSNYRLLGIGGKISHHAQCCWVSIRWAVICSQWPPHYFALEFLFHQRWYKKRLYLAEMKIKMFLWNMDVGEFSLLYLLKVPMRIVQRYRM